MRIPYHHPWVQFLEVSKEDFLNAAFHNYEHLKGKRMNVELKELLALPWPALRPMDFIVQVPFSCSTLIAKALALIDSFTVLREPFILGATSSRWDHEYTRFLLHSLMTRTFHEGQRAVVKLNDGMLHVMEKFAFSFSRIIYVEQPFDEFIVQVLQGSQVHKMDRQWYIRRHFLLEERERPIEELIARYWVGLMHTIDLWKSKLTTMTISTNDFLIRPLSWIFSIANFLNTPFSAWELDNIERSGIFKTHAKDGATAFDAKARKERMDAGKKQFAKEIRSAFKCLDKLLSQPSSEHLPHHSGRG